MSQREYLIPALASLTATFSTGCALFTDPIVGSWEMTEINGEDPSYTYTYGPECYLDIERSMEFDVEEKDGKLVGDGEMDFGYSGPCYGKSYSGSYSFDFEVDGKQTDKGEYEITFETEEGDDLDLECTLDDDVLECEDDEGNDMVFER